jgi:hypothetical protein
VARLNLPAGTRDLAFPADPTGQNGQYAVYDMALAPDGTVVVSYPGGAMASFNNGTLRPNVDLNTQGSSAYTPATYELAVNDSASIVYGYNTYLSTFEFKRDAISASGLQWLSTADGLIAGYSTPIRFAQGLIYTAFGDVIDPERSRHVGHFALPGVAFGGQVVPDPETGQVFFISNVGYGAVVSIFDISTRALLGWENISLDSGYSMALSLVRFGSDGLAFHTNDGQLYLVKISSIPLLPTPTPSPQPSLPITPGVTVIDLDAQDIAYDASRGIIYASTPNREAAMGDRVVSIDPGAGTVTASFATGINPRLLSLSDDNSELYFTSGLVPNQFASRFSFSSEGVQSVDLSSGSIGSMFAVQNPTVTSISSTSYSIQDLAVLAGQPKSVAVIEGKSGGMVEGDGSFLNGNLGPDGIRVYDSGAQRKNFLTASSDNCTAIVPGSLPSRLYCGSQSTFDQLIVDANGVSILNSASITPGNGTFGHLASNGGIIYTTTGLVIDAETSKVIASVQAQGPVAVDGNRVYWLDPAPSGSASTSVLLRSFDLSTLAPVDTRQINVSSTDVTRLVSCGQGRLAFRAGHEVYIVNPLSSSPPAVNPGGIVPLYGSASVVQPSS